MKLKNNNFKYFNEEKIQLSVGWKIHLSPYWKDVDNAENLFNDWVKNNDINLSYKIMHKKTYYNFLFPLDRIYNSQVGKFITIYPRNEAHFLKLLDLLLNKFKNWKGITPISDRQYQESSFINYRYGLIKSNDIKEYVGHLPFRLPDGIEDKTKYNPKSFLDQYEFKYMIRNSNFGSIFCVQDHLHQEFIVKDGRNSIGMNEVITSSYLRKNEWKNYNTCDLGVKPITKETYLDHNFYVYEKINFSNDLHVVKNSLEFTAHYNNWKKAIKHFKNNILTKININDYNVSNYALVNDKMIILDAKFAVLKSSKIDFTKKLKLSGPISNWFDLAEEKWLNVLFMLKLTGIYANSAKKINYHTLIYIYQWAINNHKLVDPLNIKLPKLKNKPLFKISYERVKSKIQVMSLRDVLHNWKHNFNNQVYTLKIKHNNSNYESPWLDNGSLNLIYWTLYYAKNNKLNLENYILQIIKTIEAIAKYPTFKTAKRHGLRGLLWLRDQLPTKIVNMLQLDVDQLKQRIADLEALKTYK